ncbi:hypothetical protein [Cohnella abietis]|uniref:Uncharacterized protein n=1 Tax=Cohnella abietis TaxID=2507935 RepID=A0A3T1D9I9_9BACL|nr:hypothetical protein [Cohnella abietis]BBI34739.1 hypothetical protein KCTCHS21_41380 [Cohnella abietis]
MEKTKPAQTAPQNHHVTKQPNQAVTQPVVQPVEEAVPMPVKPATYPVVAKKVTKAFCESHMHRYVEVQAADGFCYDGIVEHVDDEWICLAVPGAVDQMRGFFPHPPLYPPVGPFYPYRPRRFNRLVLPLAGLAGLALLPYYW